MKQSASRYSVRITLELPRDVGDRGLVSVDPRLIELLLIVRSTLEQKFEQFEFVRSFPHWTKIPGGHGGGSSCVGITGAAL